LLAWCVSERGQRSLQPFRDLRQQHPHVWKRCCQAAILPP
jgi:hypothetical protein